MNQPSSRLICGDAVEEMRGMPEASVHAVVTDPPYLLTNTSGHGFMGQEWDSLSPSSAVVEAYFRSCRVASSMDVENIVAENVNTRKEEECQKRDRISNVLCAEKNSTEDQACVNRSIPFAAVNVFTLQSKKGAGKVNCASSALCAEKSSIDSQINGNRNMPFAAESVITRAEALDLCNAMLPSLTSVAHVVRSLPSHAIFVESHSWQKTLRSRNIVQSIVSILRNEPEWLESAITFTSMEKENHSVTGATTGIGYENKFTNEMNTNAKSAESTVESKTSNATTSGPTKLQKTIRKITSLRSVRLAIRLCMESPTFIPSLSEVFHERWAQEAFRILKPGGYLLSFGGTRTSHRLACAVEDAGFEIRDSIAFLHGQGYPKSLNIGKAIDKAARGVPQGGSDPTSKSHGKYKSGCSVENPKGRGYGAGPGQFMQEAGEKDSGRVLVPEAQQWSGFGTALRPLHEPIVVARKPLIGTVVKNILEHGVGGINVDACRVEGGPKTEGGCKGKSRLHGGGITDRAPVDQTTGRWPPNVVFQHSEGCRPIGTRKVKGRQINRWSDGAKPFGDGAGHPYESEQLPDDEVLVWECVEGCPVRELDQQSMGMRAGKPSATGTKFEATGLFPIESDPISYDDGKVGASRFFPCFKYQAKPSTAEKEAGCEHLEGGNSHKTVKSVALMRWLCRLVCPPDGTILDCFLGSGTTGIAAHLEGFNFIGIEKDETYFRIAKARIAHHRKQLKLL